MAGFSYAYRCLDWGAVTFSYSAAILPAAILIEPGHAVYGFGITPLGFVAETARARRVHPFVEASGGVIASTEPIPINFAGATGLNFLFYFGGGARWNVTRRSALSIGYRLLHISNAGTTNFNPGVDQNVLYVGWSLLR